MTWIKSCFSAAGKLFNNHPFLFLVILSFFENLMIETLSRYSLIKAFTHFFTHPVVFLLNMLIIMFTLSFALLFRRRVFATILLSTPWIVCGIVNCAVLSFRVTPVGAIDFQIVNGNFILMYLTAVQRIFLYIGVAAFVIAVVTLWILGPKISGKINYGKTASSIVAIFICIFVTLSVAQSIQAITPDFADLPVAYEDYGFVYCFSSSVLDGGIDRPADYGEESVASLLSMLPQTKQHSSIKPDIVLVQLESFVDPKLLKNLTFSQDPAPTHTYLRENFSCGELSVPSFGGGTANTEFEVLTGINLANFGPGEYPYQTILLEEACESLAYNLKERGYSAHAIHNHTGTFYERDRVYTNLGFDSFQSIEYMYDYDTTWYGWCKDNVLTKEILTALDYTDEQNSINQSTPRFVWTVSVQGHGKYPSENIDGSSNTIKIEGDYPQEEMCALSYYVNQAWEMDMFLKNLIFALNHRNKPTVLIAYGDHLPAIGLGASDFASGDTYKTQYVTWNNIGLKKNDRNLRTYELSSQIMSWLNFNNGNLTKLHQLCADGSSAMTEGDYQKAIGHLAYDMLYGEQIQYGYQKPYEKTQMRMGTLPVSIESITYLDGALYINGEGFTQKSTVFINGKKQNTTMLSQYALMVSDTVIKAGDAVTVGQTSSKNKVLGYSTPIIYDEKIHLLQSK